MSTRPVRFKQVDVFSQTPFKGNALAVVFDADGLSDSQMQAIARWTNLSETTFVCQPTDPCSDYLVRIFTPAYELPFAGHPTLGTAHALIESGYRPRQPGRLVQQCGAGHLTAAGNHQDAALGLLVAVDDRRKRMILECRPIELHRVPAMASGAEVLGAPSASSGAP